MVFLILNLFTKDLPIDKLILAKYTNKFTEIWTKIKSRN
jgi:hypothetical protein